MLVRLGVFLLWLLHLLPFRVQVALGNGLGVVLHALARNRRHVAMTNLRLCFPQMPDAERRRLVRRNFQAFGRAFIERGILWWSSAERINRLIRVEGAEHLHALRGKTAILLTPHFVGMDVGGVWIAQQVNVVCVYAMQKSRYMTELLLRGRTRFGQQRLYPRQKGLRPVLKAMNEGMPLIYPTDQDQTVKDGAFVPFFGVPAATVTTVPRIAEMTNAKVLPCVTEVLPGGAGYVLRIYPPWEHYPTGDVIADTRRVNAFIEERVLEMPEQYFWLHKRFKTRPPGEPGFY